MITNAIESTLNTQYHSFYKTTLEVQSGNSKVNLGIYQHKITLKIVLVIFKFKYFSRWTVMPIPRRFSGSIEHLYYRGLTLLSSLSAGTAPVPCPYLPDLLSVLSQDWGYFTNIYPAYSPGRDRTVKNKNSQQNVS